MKKTTLIVTALAMVLCLAQCKKEQTPTNDAPQGTPITLTVVGSENNDSKVVVNPAGNPNYATVAFEDGDIIYVGNNGAYCGYLTYSGSAFSGTIEPTGDDNADYLHFYFMGNKGATSEPTSVNITDQTDKYPVISYAHSTEKYNSSATAYSAKLQNYCAIAKFPINGEGTSENITLRGMNNTVTVNFAANNGATTGDPYAFSKTGYGEITLHAESNTEKWAILLPQGAVDAKLYADGFNTATVSVPAIVANTYHDSDISGITLTAGTASDLFSVASGTKVRFAPGNLQYQASTNTWRFAENQYDYIGSENENISSSYSGWIDLFGWGTSGYSHGAVCYQPWSTSTSYSDYYAYGSSSYNLNDQTGEADWGYNAISNGGNTENQWRTLTNAEWGYLFNYRTDASQKYGHGSVNSVNGMIILPDVWVLPDGLSFTADNSTWGNSYTVDQWALMEANGAVFLPAAGDRLGTWVKDVGSSGCYWSSSYGSSGGANFVQFSLGHLGTQGDIYRIYGFSVRLARVAQ